MRKSLLLIFALLLLYSCKPEGALYENAICIQNVTTIDPENGLRENQTVIIQEGKIIKVGASDEIPLSSKNTIIDGTGKYLIPGLWDAHVHFAYIEDLAPAMFELFLAYGITSVRDTGGRIPFILDWKNQAEQNPTTAPRVKIAGPLMDGMPNVYDGSSPSRPPLSEGFATVEAAVRRVEQLDSLGVDLIKAYEMLSPEQFEAITQKARELNLKVTGHIPLSMDAITASKGFNSMEHLRNLEMTMTADWEDLLAQRRALLEAGKNDQGGVLRSRLHDAQRGYGVDNGDPAQTDKVIQALIDNNTWQVPTIALAAGATNRHVDKPHFKESFQYLPSAIRTKWEEQIASFRTQPVSETRTKYGEWMKTTSGKMHKAGVEFMAGTDCPIFFLTPGVSLHEELFLFQESGFSPMEILKTATVNPARYFDMEDELGLIQEGMIADLLILDANPLEDIQNTRQINSVIKAGQLHDRAALDAMLQRAASR